MASILKVNELQHTGGTSAMTVDSGGRILQPEKPHFHVTKNDGHVGASTIIIWNNKTAGGARDTESGYNTSTGKYTIPAGLTGLWWFGVSALTNNTTYTEITLKVGNTPRFNARNQGTANTNNCATINAALYATAGDEISIHTESGSSMYGTGNQYSFWTGYLIG
jgi:hypothetical protein